MINPHKKSNKAMKILLVVTMLMILICIATACQPTPKENVIVGKSEDLGEFFQSTSDTSDNKSTQTNDELYKKLEVPKYWSFKTKVLNDKLNIKADVDIKLPNIAQFPMATVTLNEFMQSDLDKVAELFGVSNASWTQSGVLTKEILEQWILECKAIISGTNKDALEGGFEDDNINRAKESLIVYEKMYNDAPSESELNKIEFKIDVFESSEGQNLIGFEGTTKVDENPFFLGAYNAYYGEDVNRIYANFGTGIVKFPKTNVETPDGVSLTKVQASEKAIAIAKQLTNDLTLSYVTPATTGGAEGLTRNWGWACVFMREINGCPTAYETTEVGHNLEAVNLPVTYEKMIIVMDDEGMVSFTWDIPMTIKSIDNPDVSLLSFNEISQRAIEQISQRFANTVNKNVVNGIDWGDPGCTASINEVKLGLTRVSKLNSTDYYYIPVWKFFVDTEHTDEYYERTGSIPASEDDLRGPDGYPSDIDVAYSLGFGRNVITINAMDGSVVDVGLGY